MTEPPAKPDRLIQKIGNSGRSGQPRGPEGIPPRGDLDMRIASDGTWFHQGSPINRKALVKLFSTLLRREDDGAYWLVTPVERGRVVVDDAPFTAVELAVKGGGESQVLAFRTNVDEWIEADGDHPLRVARDSGPDPANDNPVAGAPAAEPEPRPYILVRPGLEALILRPLFYELVALAVELERPDGIWLGVWSKGTRFPLGPVA